MTSIEEAKNLKTITIEELFGSLITHEHTFERDLKEKEVDNKKKKDLALLLLMRNMEGSDQVFYSRNFKKFVNKKILDKRGEKKNEKPQCYECKGFRHMINEIRTSSRKRKMLKEKRKKRK